MKKTFEGIDWVAEVIYPSQITFNICCNHVDYRVPRNRIQSTLKRLENGESLTL